MGVVVPAYQVEDWLERCLRSILEQDVHPAEVIVVDDGSTDTTPEIARAHEGVTLLQQENRGLAAARNAGARVASSDWILFLDADDMLLPGAIATFHATIAEWPQASVIDPAYESEYPGGRVVRPSDQPPRVYRRGDLAAVLRRNPLTANALIKRDVTALYPYDESLRSAEDLDLWLRLLLDSHEIVQMGVPTTRRAVGRGGALSAHVLTMRRSRYTVFTRLWRERRLSAAERMMLVYQIPRVTAGIAVARAMHGP